MMKRPAQAEKTELVATAATTNAILSIGLLSVACKPGLQHGSEAYELHLCEPCFFVVLSAIKRERWMQSMFTDEGDAILADKFRTCRWP